MSRYDGEPLLVGSRTVNELRHRFIGKTVRTSRVLSRREYATWVSDALGRWNDGYDFGGEGVVVFIEQFSGIMVLGVDYGMQWPIDSLTTIQVVNE